MNEQSWPFSSLIPLVYCSGIMRRSPVAWTEKGSLNHEDGPFWKEFAKGMLRTQRCICVRFHRKHVANHMMSLWGHRTVIHIILHIFNSTKTIVTVCVITTQLVEIPHCTWAYPKFVIAKQHEWKWEHCARARAHARGVSRARAHKHVDMQNLEWTRQADAAQQTLFL